MPVIPLTVVTGLCLVFTFLVFFLREHARGRMSSIERDSLLPFAEEGRRQPGGVMERNALKQQSTTTALE